MQLIRVNSQLNGNIPLTFSEKKYGNHSDKQEQLQQQNNSIVSQKNQKNDFVMFKYKPSKSNSSKNNSSSLNTSKLTNNNKNSKNQIAQSCVHKQSKNNMTSRYIQRLLVIESQENEFVDFDQISQYIGDRSKIQNIENNNFDIFFEDGAQDIKIQDQKLTKSVSPIRSNNFIKSKRQLLRTQFQVPHTGRHAISLGRQSQNHIAQSQLLYGSTVQPLNTNYNQNQNQNLSYNQNLSQNQNYNLNYNQNQNYDSVSQINDYQTLQTISKLYTSKLKLKDYSSSSNIQVEENPLIYEKNGPLPITQKMSSVSPLFNNQILEKNPEIQQILAKINHQGAHFHEQDGGLNDSLQNIKKKLGFSTQLELEKISQSQLKKSSNKLKKSSTKIEQNQLKNSVISKKLSNKMEASENFQETQYSHKIKFPVYDFEAQSNELQGQDRFVPDSQQQIENKKKIQKKREMIEQVLMAKSGALVSEIEEKLQPNQDVLEQKSVKPSFQESFLNIQKNTAQKQKHEQVQKKLNKLQEQQKRSYYLKLSEQNEDDPSIFFTHSKIKPQNFQNQQFQSTFPQFISNTHDEQSQKSNQSQNNEQNNVKNNLKSKLEAANNNFQNQNINTQIQENFNNSRHQQLSQSPHFQQSQMSQGQTPFILKDIKDQDDNKSDILSERSYFQKNNSQMQNNSREKDNIINRQGQENKQLAKNLQQNQKDFIKNLSVDNFSIKNDKFGSIQSNFQSKQHFFKPEQDNKFQQEQEQFNQNPIQMSKRKYSIQEPDIIKKTHSITPLTQKNFHTENQDPYFDKQNKQKSQSQYSTLPDYKSDKNNLFDQKNQNKEYKFNFNQNSPLKYNEQQFENIKNQNNFPNFQQGKQQYNNKSTTSAINLQQFYQQQQQQQQPNTNQILQSLQKNKQPEKNRENFSAPKSDLKTLKQIPSQTNNFQYQQQQQQKQQNQQQKNISQFQIPENISNITNINTSNFNTTSSNQPQQSQKHSRLITIDRDNHHNNTLKTQNQAKNFNELKAAQLNLDSNKFNLPSNFNQNPELIINNIPQKDENNQKKQNNNDNNNNLKINNNLNSKYLNFDKNYPLTSRNNAENRQKININPQNIVNQPYNPNSYKGSRDNSKNNTFINQIKNYNQGQNYNQNPNSKLNDSLQKKQKKQSFSSDNHKNNLQFVNKQNKLNQQQNTPSHKLSFDNGEDLSPILHKNQSDRDLNQLQAKNFNNPENLNKKQQNYQKHVDQQNQQDKYNMPKNFLTEFQKKTHAQQQQQQQQSNLKQNFLSQLPQLQQQNYSNPQPQFPKTARNKETSHDMSMVSNRSASRSKIFDKSMFTQNNQPQDQFYYQMVESRNKKNVVQNPEIQSQPVYSKYRSKQNFNDNIQQNQQQYYSQMQNPNFIDQNNFSHNIHNQQKYNQSQIPIQKSNQTPSKQQFVKHEYMYSEKSYNQSLLENDLEYGEEKLVQIKKTIKTQKF
ncbi:hypothetical protein PPERSA_13121 [Pseudocohnilembus persalinus]|uniref:Uncharacterized protein n=1 Tax=Pseudocohnilembus persalinus TaxID=266149 RepID=A0A0V0QWM6_PSEPJ|nr:hypothetical protein PPERSA_13121 [Pseudocohnilembus persalinus]|eukprot:KRX06642.1 hypothetical protein PPERSA_13121 [Pseudocohnilembus persalinus]